MSPFSLPSGPRQRLIQKSPAKSECLAGKSRFLGGHFLLICALVGGFAQESSAVIIADNSGGTGNITATGAGGGWNYVGSVNGASGIYLGQYGGGNWVLTANHVGAGNFISNGTTYNLVGGSDVQVAGIDLRVFQIVVPGGDTNLLPLSNLSLNSNSVLGSETTMIGFGRNRAATETTYYVDTTPATWTWSESNFVGADSTAGGYKWGPGNTKRWGLNTIDSQIDVSGTMMLSTDFDPVVGEGQVAVGDSGGGMFTLDGGNWELAGVLDLQGTFNNQPGETAVFGDATYAIDVASYRTQILAAIPEPSSFTLLGGSALLFAAIRRRKSA